MSTVIRHATLDDAAAVCVIYNHYIQHTTITFEEVLLEAGEMRARIEKVTAVHPWFVAEVDGVILGYAYGRAFHERSAYRFTCEAAVYLRHDAGGRGLGSQLYTALLAELRDRGMHIVIGGIALPNDASLALHKKFGFQEAAHYREVGWKFERWIDVAYLQLNLASGPASVS
jgi:L-amino acid N-acyltransferase YncA